MWPGPSITGISVLKSCPLPRFLSTGAHETNSIDKARKQANTTF